MIQKILNGARAAVKIEPVTSEIPFDFPRPYHCFQYCKITSYKQRDVFKTKAIYKAHGINAFYEANLEDTSGIFKIGLYVT